MYSLYISTTVYRVILRFLDHCHHYIYCSHYKSHTFCTHCGFVTIS
jgi:hypothetical protein